MNILKTLMVGAMFMACTTAFSAPATDVTFEEGVATDGFKVTKANNFDFSINFGPVLNQGYLTWSVVQNAYNTAHKPTALASVSIWLDGVKLDSFTNQKNYENSLTLANLTGTHFLQFKTSTKNGYIGAGSFSIVPAVPVPEPETYALMGLGLLGLLATRRHKLVK
ncbi:PEP-CTERM sorting domain-containing protein [Iodobacter sp. CM08]|uniref:PEP-CTERM sorting domain-containing protein n=1 Tax=Iodobacter sp. CM08 TaxID=3085902 RepID=UPI002980B985|nr:PEP-CTERM sorting domain-containing protein [Iodobacter sp. CM08]MDW5418178.1 PEP-CTERM sorting domain-containing protein [Iodobacter sp. CM08]